MKIDLLLQSAKVKFVAGAKKIKQHKWEAFFVLSLIFLGIFLRTYNFSSWLHFEIDQSYDFLMVSPAVEDGIENLPLLGPTAGGGRALRLGPAFYYMEYVSAKIFGNNPTGHAMNVLILSALALPLFYLFCKRYFSVRISIGLLTIFSTSLYLVLYSRFSWSPNVLPFLVIFSFYALLRSISEKEKNRDFWFIIFSFFLAITTQIHFNAFFIIPAVSIVFLIIKRPRFKLKTWFFSVAIFLFFYIPVIASEIKTGGQDLKFFGEKVSIGENSVSDSETTQEPEKDGKKIGERIFQDLRYHAYEYLLVVTGEDVANGSRPKSYNLGINCPSCAPEKPWRIGGLIFFALGAILLVHKLIEENDKERKSFLLLCLLWLLMSFFYFFAITYDGLYIYPRFFLVVSPLPIIFLGLIFETIQVEKRKISLLIFAIIIILLAYINLSRVKDVFRQLKNAPYQNTKVEKEDIFPNNYRITQEQQILITDYISKKSKANNYPIYLKTIHEYEPTLWYYLEKKGFSFYEKPFANEIIYKESNYFLVIYNTNSKKRELEKYTNTFDIAEKKEFGALIAYHLIPRVEKITTERQLDSKKGVPLQKEQISQLITWKKLFSE